MKRKKNIILIFSIGLLILGAYTLPVVVSHFEDNHLQSQIKRFEMEEISLQSSNTSLLEKLAIFQDLIAGNIVVKPETEALESDSFTLISPYETLNLKKNVEEFLSLLTYEGSPVLQTFDVSYIAMTRADLDSVYPLWKCYALDENQNKYLFWLDETTGMVLACEIPAELMQMDAENLKVISKELAGYYGISSFDLWESSGTLKEEFWYGTYYYSNEEYGLELLLPLCKDGERFLFNMYPLPDGVLMP